MNQLYQEVEYTCVSSCVELRGMWAGSVRHCPSHHHAKGQEGHGSWSPLTHDATTSSCLSGNVHEFHKM